MPRKFYVGDHVCVKSMSTAHQAREAVICQVYTEVTPPTYRAVVHGLPGHPHPLFSGDELQLIARGPAARWAAEDEAAKANYGDLTWIFSNGPEIAKAFYGESTRFPDGVPQETLERLRKCLPHNETLRDNTAADAALRYLVVPYLTTQAQLGWVCLCNILSNVRKQAASGSLSEEIRKL